MSDRKPRKKRTIQVHPGLAAAIGCPERVPYDDAQVRAKLLAYRDGALDWWGDLLAERDGKGIGTAMYAVAQANAQIDRMDQKATGSSGHVNITVNGFDVSRLAFGSNVANS